MYFSKENKDFLFSSSVEKLSEKMKSIPEFKEWIINAKVSEDRIYYDFCKPNKGNVFECNILDYFIPKFIRRLLISEFEKQGLIIEPLPHVIDFSVYKLISAFNDTWDIYHRYDFIIKHKFKELSINLGSEYTLISKSNIEYKEEFKSVKHIENNSNYIYSYSTISKGDKKRIVANFEIKQTLNATKPIRLQYKNRYNQVFNFYNEHVKIIQRNELCFVSNGLQNAYFRDIFKINILENKMVFKNEKTDINPITGMRDYGIFKSSPKALENQFIFIYENNNDANELYKYLKNGYKNFPGLERYVGVPVTLSDKKGFSYSGKNIETAYQEFETTYLTENYYPNLFAIVIGKFDKNKTTEEKTNEYYNIKNALLKKGISSQFINQEHIRQSTNFNYHLPNIAIGIVAKLGGIPWRLKNSIKKDLIIGFNQFRLDNNQFIGSSVFFTNEGLLENVYSYSSVNSESEMIQLLKNSIQQYIESNTEIYRLIIHYYKPNNNKETKRIEKLLYDELKLNIPYAIIEINDTKTQSDICFDVDYNMGMPISGTYIKVGRDEYLLFNNTRHIEKPLTMVTDELPIKIKIHFADNSGFSHNELISQIYEFSRLIWKGLKQRSQPATTIYAKLIANFSAHLGGVIPSNELTTHTPWFI
jgi:hypothetical protein